tara:strand:+ start:3384 stop:4370 length:987 start_codon:yes stop_codon:yes gene_type:complete
LNKKIQLLGIGNAIVDILAHVNNQFLRDIGACPGSMTLIDNKEAEQIYNKMKSQKEISGGSVANTVTGFSKLGGTAAYIGRVKDDHLGNIFVNDMQSIGVDMRLKPSKKGAPTARCYVLITDDGERTMQTYLGACTELSREDITSKNISLAETILIEGYIWDIPDGLSLTKKALEISKVESSKTALSLSDSLCVDRHRQQFHEAIDNNLDIIFGNENEIMSLYEVNSFDKIPQKLKHLKNLFVITRGTKGSIIFYQGNTITQEALSVNNVVDTTGAGDVFAAAFLYGLASKNSLKECSLMANWCASKIIQQSGARLDINLPNKYKNNS